MLPKLRSLLVCTIALLLTATALGQNTIHVPADQPTIQAGINAANTGDTVLVAPGTYYENIDFKGKAITVTSSDGAAKTTIDGGATVAPVVTFQSKETRSSILSGFTLQNGNLSPFPFGGGGVSATDSSPTILNNVITHNVCQGVYSMNSSPLVQNNEIDNTLDTPGECGFAGGSAIWLLGSLGYESGTTVGLPVPEVIGNILQNNTQSGVEDAGGNGGAGVAVWTGNAVIENNIVRDNLSHGSGAGIHLEGSEGSIVVQNLVYNNESGGGGAFDVDGGDGAILSFIANNTFAYNTYGGGGDSSTDEGVSQIYFGEFVFSGSQVAFVNNIVAAATQEPAVACGSLDYPDTNQAALILDHNLFFNSVGPTFYLCMDPTGTYGNILADPKFRDSAASDFHLLPSSPAIDAGNNSVNAFLSTNTIAIPLTLSADLDKNPRLQDGTGEGFPIIDIGAYEFAGVQDANATTILLTPSEYYAAAGDPATLTAKAISANGKPTGAITFSEDLKTLQAVTLDLTGTAVEPLSLTPGTHHFDAMYPGQGVFTAAQAIQTVIYVTNYQPSLTLTSTPNPSFLGQSVTFTASISSADTNQLGPIVVTNTLTNATLATLTPDASGKATFATSSLPLGDNYIQANYAGNATHNGASSATLDEQVITAYPTSTTLSCNPTTINIGATSLLSAMVTSTNGTPTGAITFTDGTTTLGTLALTNGSSTYTYTGNSAGAHTLTATYVPTGTFAASSATCSVTVKGLPTTTTVAVTPNPSTYGQIVTFSTHVTPATATKLIPTGNVLLTFCRGATINLGQIDASGNASVSTQIPEPVGSCAFTGEYSGDTTFDPSTSASVTYVVNAAPSTTALTAAPNPAYVSQPVSFTVQVTGMSSPGVDPITGNPIPRGPLHFSGTIQLFEGTSAITPPAPVTTTSASTARTVLTVSTLTPGSHIITATYTADPNLGSSTSPAVTEVILASDFTFTGPASITFRTESTGKGTLILGSLYGFTGPVALTCNPPFPPNYLCTLSPSTASLPANGGASSTITLQPNLRSSTTPRSSSATPRILFATFLPLALLALVFPRHARRRRYLSAAISLALMTMVTSALTACGGDIFYAATPPGTYPITITATGIVPGSSAPITHTLPLNLVITP